MNEHYSPNVPDVAPAYVGGRPDETPPSPREASTASTAGSSASGEYSSRREGECVPNTPDVRPNVLNADETAKLVAAPVMGGNEELISRSTLFPGFVRWGYLLATLALVALFGVFAFSQVISALAQASLLPEWQRYALLAPLLVCGLLLLVVAGSLVWSWFRLRAIHQFDMSALDELKSRAEIRRDGIEHFQAARKALEVYVRDYPLTGRNAEALRRAGVSDETLGALHKNREYLLTREVDSRAWLADYHELFQKHLDRAAFKRVNAWSLRAAGCVIASPLPLLDSILVLGISLRLIKQLCVLYNVRTGGTSSLLLFSRAIRNAFIAGLADEAGDAAGELLGEEMAGILGEGGMGVLGASFVRVAAPKLGEGALNGLFMRRLGKATVRLLQPLRV